MFHWTYLGACVLVAGLGAGMVAGRAIRTADSRRGVWRDVLALLTLVPAGLFTVHPYVSRDLVGAGDSYFYGLQVADFVSQTRGGVMPVLIGQSDYAFNGNVHTVKTAPYFTHLAGLMDVCTGGRLSFVTLQNLTVTVTAILAAWAAYGSCLLLSGGRRVASWLLAVLYGASPAIMGPLVVGDMFATYMTAPWLILCWCGLAGIIRQQDDGGPQLLAAGALALTWYAHPPIAAWLSLLWAAVQVVKLGLAGGTRQHWQRQVLAAACFLGLAAYVLACLATIDSGPMTPVDRPGREYDPAALQRVLQSQFSPALLRPDAPSIQLGWSLWLGLVAATVTALHHRRIAGLMFASLLGLLVCLLFPSPLGESLWRLLPAQLAAQSAWPEQRLCPLLAAGAVTMIALSLREQAARSSTGYRWICWLLGLGCAWSAVEAAVLNWRPGLARIPPAAQALQYSPANVALTRYSYIFAAKLPPYFTHGWTDPEFETRLLDGELDPMLDNASAILRGAGSPAVVALAPTAIVDFAGPGEYLADFGFQHPEASGELSIRGSGLQRHYALPRSGQPLAFGSHPSGSKAIPLRLHQPGNHQIAFTATVPGASLRVFPVNRAALPIRLAGQIPFTAEINAPATGFVETPKLFLEGYAATVNGTPADVRPSPSGLAMIPVPSGRSQVIVHYRGPAWLRAAWFISLAGLALYPWLLLRAWGTLMPADAAAPKGWIGRDNLVAVLVRWWKHRGPRWGLAVILAGLLVAAIPAVRQAWHTYRDYGSLHLVIELPKHPVDPAEPLLTLGRPGAADCIYIRYEDARHIRLGYDHWGYGGPMSEPIPVSYGEQHRLEISALGLYPAGWWLGRPGPATVGPDGRAWFELKLNGRVIFRELLPAHAAGVGEVAVGQNSVGSSTAGARFSGRILSVQRRPDAAAPGASSMQ